MWSCSYYYEEGWRCVIEHSIKCITKKAEVKNIKIVYNLLFTNAYYSLECYKEESDIKDPINYCFVEDFTEDEGEAQAFLIQMAKGKVYPVHIKDLVEDIIQE